MQEIINCPSCKKKLQVPEGLIGQDVQCPTCGATFTARVGSPVPTVSPDRYSESPKDRWEEDRDRDRDRGRDRDDDYRRRDYEDRGTRRDLMPHRGSAVLTIGIISIVGCFICPIISVIMGPIAWTMGNTDTKEIRTGRMDPDGEGTTTAGKICGIVGTVLGLIFVLGMCAYFGLIAMMINKM
jgi:hypothetical protein